MMRRLCGVLLACAVILVPAYSHGHGDLFAQSAPQKTTFTGDMVVMLVSVNADKTADYESAIQAVKETLSKSEAAEAKQQLAGWKVIKNPMPNPDGSIIYIHVISPVVKDADYSIVNNIFAGRERAEADKIYNAYRAAFKASLGTIQGAVVMDGSK